MTVRRLLLATAALLSLPLSLHAEQWTQPTPEELALTSVPQAPGAPAIYLFREQITEDKMHVFSVHARLKVLTAGGLDKANIELPYLSGGETGFSLDELSGRTIHPDGSVVPFSGKPYNKLIEKHGSSKYMAKVFSLPDVTPGSILEYRYKLRYNDNVYVSPDWFVQEDLFTRKVHYLWLPETGKYIVTGDGRQMPITSISWTPILPSGAEVKQAENVSHQLSFELTANNIEPFPEEDQAPPLKSFSYRVLFYMTPYRDRTEFWSKEGKRWAKQQDKFIGSASILRSAAAEFTAGADTPDAKLHKLYVAVQKLENTDNTREHSTSEDKAEGLKAVNNVDDVLLRKRGSGNQLALLFVGLARATGFQAYAMDVTRRDRSIFFENYLNLNQLDDTLAVVNLNGKDEFFDPGVHLCPYHELSWPHQKVQGLRQTPDGNSVIAVTPGSAYRTSHVTRVADLTLDDHGTAVGTVTLTYTGAPALKWRQRYSTEDEAAARHDLAQSVQEMLPGGFAVELMVLDGLADPEHVLVAKFKAHGPVGSGAGRRLILPADLFQTNAHPLFPSETRKLGIDLQYASFYQDAVRFKLPPSLVLESAPEPSKLTFKQFAFYDLSTQTTPGSITVRRDQGRGEFLYMPSEYVDLRHYQQSTEVADSESIVLKQNSTTPITPAVAVPATP